MRIADAALEHAAGIAAVHVLTWQYAYAGLIPAEYLRSLSVAQREQSWRTQLAQGTPRVLVALEADTVIGFASFGQRRDTGVQAREGELWALYVSPGHWDQGVGRALWLATRERLRAEGYEAVTLWVLEGNERAIRFYRAAGFTQVPGSASPIVLGGATLQHLRYVTALS